MKKDELADLVTFMAVVEERSFTRAAVRIGTSQSAVSHTMRRLEERLDLRLLTRTTRSVSPTEAGQKLADTVRPAFQDIEARLDSLNDYRQKVTGTLRITASKTPAQQLLLPIIQKLIAEHPHLEVEISLDLRLIDLVAEGFDAGVRLGEQVEKDMIATRIGPDLRMMVVGSPKYFANRKSPQIPQELTGHICVNLRLPTSGGLYAWEFEKDGRELKVRVEGQLIFNDPDLVIQATLGGAGLCCMTDDILSPYVESGQLVAVLQDWCPPFPGFHLYYPSRHRHSAAFKLLLEALKQESEKFF